MRKIAALVLLLALASCETPTTQRYSISAANNLAIKSLPAKAIAVGTFSEPVKTDLTCRLLGPVNAPDGMTHTQYIRKAFEDELKVAGAYASSGPIATISGSVEEISFGSMSGLTGGHWDIRLKLTSSNGRTMTTSEHYEFKSGFSADNACRQTANAFLPAVQDLIQKFVTAPEFAALTVP